MKYELTPAAREVLSSVGINPSMIDERAYMKLIDQSPVWSYKIFDSAVRKVKPVYADEAYNPNEDYSDPETIHRLKAVAEAHRVSDNALELIELIRGSVISRRIKKIIFHCTATSQEATVSSIKRYWKENLGWNNPGYHILIKPNGSWVLLQDFNKLSNGVRGHNSDSINISYIGGVDRKEKPLDNRTENQKEILKICYKEFKKKIHAVEFYGHNYFSSKACPSFNVQNWIESIK